MEQKRLLIAWQKCRRLTLRDPLKRTPRRKTEAL